MCVSTPLPLLDLLTLWNHMEGSVPPFLLKVCFMEKFRDNMEIIFLITIFVSSLSAITPIT